MAEQMVTAADEVRAALTEGRPVVALESTIISHGLPRPRNLEVALELEETLREAGVVPATVGVVAGRALVGLGPDELELLAMSDGVAKASTRDLPVALAARRHAGTTVAATSFLAASAGIECFATGGIGGVHRGAAETFDESADLVALSRTPVTVVCAGVKSILDVPATLERLETLAVPVVGYGTKRFPGFYVADSGEALEWSVDSPAEVAAVVAARRALGMKSALVIANPVPEEHELDPALHDRLVAEALEAAGREGVTGKAVTPFLLEYLLEASGGRSLEANIAAVRNNVALAAAVAKAVSAGAAP
jgi:pseudouridine-5'-phosphate glycosidase